MHDNDWLRRQLDTSVEFLDCRIISGLDLAQVDPCESRSIKSEFSRLNSFQVNRWDHPAHHGRELGKAALLELGLGKRISPAPNVTVLTSICLIPPPEPID